MSIFTKLKTATDFSASVIKEGFALIWPEKKSDGRIALQVKLEDGSVQEIGGGSDIDTNAMVRIYDATVESSTGVVTITDGTPVTDLRIGDEIRTPDGVYQKTKDSITTGSPADGTRIKVSGITSPAEANGLYILTETEKVWKHESADYWISQWSGSYWLIANTSSPSNPGISIFYASGSSSSMPWEMSNWSAMSGSGSPVLENASTEQIVTDTISLFEYASLAGDVTRLGNAVNQAGGLLRIDLETNAIPEEYLDTSRLLPDPSTLSDSLNGSPVCYFATNAGIDDVTLLLLHFDGTIDDSSSNRAQAQKIGNVTFSKGKFDKAAEFKRNSGGSYIKLPNSEIFNLASKSEWTIDGWFFLETDAKYYCILSKRCGDQPTSFQIGINENPNRMYFYTGDHTCYSNNSVQLNTWTHFIFSYKNGTLKIWLNGELDSTHPSVSFTDYDCDIEIGYHYSSLDEQFVGKLDELRLSSVDRTADETDKLYSADGSSYTVPDSAYGIQTKSYIVNDSVIPHAISAHNTSLDAHPMQGATTNDYNGLDTNCSWYLSYGNNTSNVNAPANGPFFVMTKKWTNSSETAGAGMQIAIRNMTGNLVNQSVYVRTWSMSSGWRTWQKVGSSAMAGTPDYKAGVDITSTLQQGVYAAPSAGWIYATANGVSISGNLIGNVIQIVLPVAAGDTITADVVTIAKFYPNR